jgi:hypothetical protein
MAPKTARFSAIRAPSVALPRRGLLWPPRYFNVVLVKQTMVNNAFNECYGLGCLKHDFVAGADKIWPRVSHPGSTPAHLPCAWLPSVLAGMGLSCCLLVQI